MTLQNLLDETITDRIKSVLYYKLLVLDLSSDFERLPELNGNMTIDHEMETITLEAI